jgi:hypothetical protein
MQHVLHELIWDDWFKDIPIASILDQRVQYGILITPGNLSPWIMFHGGSKYEKKLSEHLVEVGSGITRFPMALDEVPLYLASDIDRLMEIYESEQDLKAWFETHLGIAMDWKAIWWDGQNPADFNEKDYLVLKINAKEVTRIAIECSPVWCKW